MNNIQGRFPQRTWIEPEDQGSASKPYHRRGRAILAGTDVLRAVYVGLPEIENATQLPAYIRARGCRGSGRLKGHVQIAEPGGYLTFVPMQAAADLPLHKPTLQYALRLFADEINNLEENSSYSPKERNQAIATYDRLEKIVRDLLKES